MLPAFFVLAAMKLGGLSFPAAMLVGFAAALLVLGLLFKQLVVAPIIRHGVLPVVISTIALAILLKEGVKEFYAADAQPFPAAWATTNLHLGEAVISVQNLVIIGVALAAVALLQFFLGGTRTGRRMQATAQNPTLALALGIPVQRMILYTFLINAGLVALASFLVSPIYLAKFTNGEALGLAAFIALKWWERRRLFRKLRMARISPRELQERMRGGGPIVVLDVRHEAAQRADPAQIPGALIVSPDEIEERLGRGKPDREIVLYCT